MVTHVRSLPHAVNNRRGTAENVLHILRPCLPRWHCEQRSSRDFPEGVGHAYSTRTPNRLGSSCLEEALNYPRAATLRVLLLRMTLQRSSVRAGSPRALVITRAGRLEACCGSVVKQDLARTRLTKTKKVSPYFFPFSWSVCDLLRFLSSPKLSRQLDVFCR